jgi:primary-amine oxidase
MILSIVDFSKMANSESLLADEEGDYDGDLVLYFNLGAHHVPHSGDLPNTLMHTSASSVMFVPHNFLDRDASRKTATGVRLDLKGRNGAPWSNEHDSPSSDLRSRLGRSAAVIKGRGEIEIQKAKATYFGGTYTKGVKLTKEDLEPDLTGYNDGAGHSEISDLSFNGSTIGVFIDENEMNALRG